MKKKILLILLIPVYLCLLTTPICHANSVKNNNDITNLQKQINNKNKEITSLKQQDNKKNNEVTNLKQQNNKKDKEITSLKQKKCIHQSKKIKGIIIRMMIMTMMTYYIIWYFYH